MELITTVKKVLQLSEKMQPYKFIHFKKQKASYPNKADHALLEFTTLNNLLRYCIRKTLNDLSP